MAKEAGFYIGRDFDPQIGETVSQDTKYDPDDLTTHAVVVGMTGSGKTGLCVDMMEEAALKGIPALMIDPKGDITNLLLHFPELAPDDFQPWINPDQARRADKTIQEAAEQTADLWRNGLAKWDIHPERLQALKEAAQFTVYTPGSDAGIPISILASLEAPPIAWDQNEELLREKISGTVTALLGLVGMQDIDPVRSREHILLANIFEQAWSQGVDLDLGELILQTQNPPFSKLGVFDVNTFFPEKDRFELAMLLNNILAAPAFQVWLEGQPLDIQGLLYTPDGRPRHSIFYIAHLPDGERMFFVTLLFSAVEAWMRTQAGTTSLRSLLYFDEIFGYLPPTQNPPSKEPMLRMLKQARAFGVGLVLVTQNPVDLDYKGLSNTGTWFIGKLQTDQDKQRLLDGLQGATPDMDRGGYDKMISSLGKRVFLLHNVHEKKPQLFQTRWAMNYLAGPLTRTQIPLANQLVGARAEALPPDDAVRPSFGVEETSIPVGRQPSATVSQPKVESEQGLPGSATRPAVPGQIAEYFLPNDLSYTNAFSAAGRSIPEEAQSLGLIYRPALLAQSRIRYLNRKYDLDYEQEHTVLTTNPDRRGVIRWEEALSSNVEVDSLDDKPDPRARFGSIEAPLSEPKIMKSMQSDFLDWNYHNSSVTVRANEELEIYAGPQVSQAEFRKLCSETAREKREAELKKVADKFDGKIDTVLERMKREQRELEEDRSELSQRKMEEYGTHAETVLSLFGRRRKSLSRSLSKRRMTEKAEADVKESLQAIEEYERQVKELQAEQEEALKEVNERWEEIASQMTEIVVTPYKKDIQVELFGVAWLPYYLAQIGGQILELEGYSGAA
ncbi:MAG: helicase HerA domain-containing protein, partial [Anaerolineales bacterium]